MSRWIELKRIGVLRAANLAGVVGFVLYGVIALLMAPVFLVLTRLTPEQQPGVPSMWIFGVMLVAYPFLGGVFGWLFAALGSLIYNFVARMIGGLALEIDDGGKRTPPA